jgi:hypothetical protein
MSIIKSNMTAPPPAAAGGGGSPILSDIGEMNSLRFDGSSYLSRGFTGGNKLVHTVSFWVKRSVLSVDSTVFSAGAPADTNHIYKIGFSTSNQLETWGYSPNAFSSIYSKTTNALYRDTSSWYHVIQVVDYSNQSGNDRVKLYVNGTQVTSFSAEPTGNADSISSVSSIGNSYTYMIGRYAYASQPYFSGGYLANIHFIDGSALDANAFGERISDIWVPKQYGSGDPTDTATVLSEYGTNGFHLDFADSANIGNDASGRGNHWTVH